MTVGPPWPFGALCAGQSSVDPILAGVPYGVSLSRLPPAFRAYASIHGPLCPLAPKGRHGPSARGRHGPSGPSVRGRAPSIHVGLRPVGSPSAPDSRYAARTSQAPCRTPPTSHRRSCTSSVWQGAGHRSHFSADASSYLSMHSGG